MSETYVSIVQFLPELTLLLTALCIMLFDFAVPRQRARFPIIAAAGALIACSLSYDALSQPRAVAFAGVLVIDAWTAAFRMIAMLVAAIALLLAARSPKNKNSDDGADGADGVAGVAGDYSVLVLSSAFGICVMASSRDLLVTVLGLEIMSLSIYPLVTLAGTRAGYEAAIKYFLMGAVASAVMLFGMSFIFGETGTTRYFAVSQASGPRLIGLAFFFAGLFFKIAAVPFHAWLPDVYEATPAPLGGYMAAGVKAAAFAAMGRLLAYSLPLDPSLIQILMVLAACAMIVGNMSALMQSNLARLIGFSAIAHTGFLLMGIAASAQKANAFGVSAVLFYLMAYAPAVIGAFAVVAMIERERVRMDDARNPHLAGARNIDLLKGLFARQPLVGVAFAILMASLAGLPPTVGFWAKFEILLASFQAGHVGLVALALVNSLLAATYYVRLIREVFSDGWTGQARLGSSGDSKLAPALASSVVVVLCSLLVILSGVLPDMMMHVADTASRALGDMR